MAVFLFVIGSVISIFISVVQHQKEILFQQELLNQVSYALEYMSKALRMALKDSDGGCLGEGHENYIYLLTNPNEEQFFYKGIKFINASDNNSCQEFYLDSVAGVLMEVKNGASPVALTSQKIKINSIKFGINGENGCYGAGCKDGISQQDRIQPRITITLEIQPRAEGQQATRRIQTTVSQRNLNVE